jgi:hypothetical protein
MENISEDGGNMFLRNTIEFERTSGRYIPDDSALPVEYLSICSLFDNADSKTEFQIKYYKVALPTASVG